MTRSLRTAHAPYLGDNEPCASLANCHQSAWQGADALIIVTEWKEFRSPDFELHSSPLLKQPVIFDGRNLYDHAMVRGHGH